MADDKKNGSTSGGDIDSAGRSERRDSEEVGDHASFSSLFLIISI